MAKYGNTKKYIHLLLLAALGLAGCSTMGPGDTAPNGKFDASKVPDAVPKVEPLSRSGNAPTYVVAGHRYYVLKSAKGYDKVGTASWYGTKFHGRYTSSREPYDMYAMTAASTTLPIPTYVHVTNLANGRSVIVKVNDRGPFKSNRIMDLSYAAASKLGYIGHGTARVRVVAIDPGDPSSQYFAANDVKNPVADKAAPIATKPPVLLAENTVPNTKAKYLQVGAFSNLKKAESISRQIADFAQLSADQVAIKEGHTNKNAPIYRVHIGPLADASDSQRIVQVLAQHGFQKPLAVTG